MTEGLVGGYFRVAADDYDLVNSMMRSVHHALAISITTGNSRDISAFLIFNDSY